MGNAEFVAGMVLGKSAVRLRVRSTFGTGSQIRDQFLQLDRAPPGFDPDEYFARGRSDEKIELIGAASLLVAAGFDDDMFSQPSLLEDQARGGRELAQIFPEKADRFSREYPVSSLRLGLRVARQELGRDFATLVNREQGFA